MRPVVLIIRDGWGLNPRQDGNSVASAKTPYVDELQAKYPWSTLDACGEAVGLPAGYQGSSEVGHLNMGAGRIVIQELKRIDDGLSSGSLFETDKWRSFVAAWKKGGGRLHFLGLLQNEGVHAHQEHLYKLMRRAREEWPEGEIVVHPFLDGRDTPPRSTMEFVSRLEKEMAAVGGCRIGTVMGRYYGMDRAKNWALTDEAFDVLCRGEASGCRKAATAADAVAESYAGDRTPDGQPMTDEYIVPYAIGGYDGIRDGDVVFHTNYRQDRAIQLSQAFVSEDYPGTRKVRPAVAYMGFTRYWDEFDSYLLGAMGGEGGGGMDNLLGQVVSAAGIKQLRIAETQKFRHVTSFFNGKSTKPSEGEDQVNIPSRFDPATFASHPEMDAFAVTSEIFARLDADPEKYGLIVVNYANCDMVGHTGDPFAAQRAVEIVDENVGSLVQRLLKLDAKILITADHGNADQMVNYETGAVMTSHSMNPVSCIYVANDAAEKGVKMAKEGILSSIAPTILEMMGLPVPADMTSPSLLVK